MTASIPTSAAFVVPLRALPPSADLTESVTDTIRTVTDSLSSLEVTATTSGGTPQVLGILRSPPDFTGAANRCTAWPMSDDLTEDLLIFARPSNSVSGPSLATGMSGDPANAGGDHEAVTTLPMAETEVGVAIKPTSLAAMAEYIENICRTGTGPGTSGPERDFIGATNSEFAQPEKSGESRVAGALAASSPQLSAPLEPAGVEVGFGQAPEINSVCVGSVCVNGCASSRPDAQGSMSAAVPNPDGLDKPACLFRGPDNRAPFMSRSVALASSMNTTASRTLAASAIDPSTLSDIETSTSVNR